MHLRGFAICQPTMPSLSRINFHRYAPESRIRRGPRGFAFFAFYARISGTFEYSLDGQKPRGWCLDRSRGTTRSFLWLAVMFLWNDDKNGRMWFLLFGWRRCGRNNDVYFFFSGDHLAKLFMIYFVQRWCREQWWFLGLGGDVCSFDVLCQWWWWIVLFSYDIFQSNDVYPFFDDEIWKVNDVFHSRIKRQTWCFFPSIATRTRDVLCLLMTIETTKLMFRFIRWWYFC